LTSVLSVVLFAPVAITINRHVVNLTYVQGESMYPYFNSDFHQTTAPDWTLNWRWKPSQNLKRGMIVTFM
jgi:inner membrane protease subunit 2